MREVSLPRSRRAGDTGSFLACLATILELPLDALPRPAPAEDVLTGWTVSRWLGGRGVGLVPVAEPAAFSWPGPWIARVRPPGADGARFVVMFGVPSGLVWDPADGAFEHAWIDAGVVVAAADIALAMPLEPAAPAAVGSVVDICVAASAGEPVRHLEAARMLAGRGVGGDRHVTGSGTFPSGPPGSALTMIGAEVCDSFEPPLAPDEHRRNLVTSGIDLGALVGHEFTIGAVRCRGMRLCEPCTVVQGYAARPVLRELVHRGGLRADILEDGEIRLGDEVRAVVVTP